MKMKIWLWILSAFLIFTFWGLGSAYERIFDLTLENYEQTQVINQHADVLDDLTEIIDEHTVAIIEIIFYLGG